MSKSLNICECTFIADDTAHFGDKIVSAEKTSMENKTPVNLKHPPSIIEVHGKYR